MKEIPKIEDVIGDYPEFTGIHPIANIFPMKPEGEFWELVEHIREAGLKNKLFREKGTGLLIDGRNRLLAVSITDSLFEIEDIDTDSVLDAVIAANMHAKKYDASQGGMIAAKLRPMFDERAKRRQVEALKRGNETKHGGDSSIVEKIPQSTNTKARDEAGKAAGVNGRYVDMASQVLSVDKDLAEEVASGKTHLRDAHAIVKPIIQAQRAEQKANKPSLSPTVEMAQIITVDGKVTEIKKPALPTFNTTNDSVSWANWTWNPVTGCNHGCKFCYAREIANSDRMAAVYPFQFAPAFHDYRLSAPSNTKRKNSDDPRDGRVFVCSMADLFGKWVPEEWIQKVFQACAESPEWEYLFLTKWPKRYSMLATLPKAWFGASIIKQGDVERVTNDMTSFETHDGIVRWISLEPMLEPIVFGDLSWCDLVVIGAQTSTRQPEGFVPEFAPNFEWVADVVAQCREQGIPYYLKPNLATAPGMNLTQMEPRRK